MAAKAAKAVKGKAKAKVLVSLSRGVKVLPQKNWASHQLAIAVCNTLRAKGIVLTDLDVWDVAKSIRAYRREERKVN